MPSNIHVFVRFKEPSVFAGEDVECTITFRNVANLQQASSSDPRGGTHSRRASLVEQVASTPRVPSSGWNKENPRLAAAKLYHDHNNVNRGHKATTSLSIPASSGIPLTSSAIPSAANSFAKHQRSVSIISLGSQDVENDHQKQIAQKAQRTRPDLGHKRASTVQIFQESIPESNKEIITGTCKNPHRHNVRSYICVIFFLANHHFL